MKTFKHDDIVRENLIEKYLMQQLNQEQETAFEEHLLYCSHCREELQRLEKIITGIKDTLYLDGFPDKTTVKVNNHEQKKTKHVLFPRQVITIAAGIILLLGLTGILYIVMQRTEPTILTHKEEKKEDRLPTVKHDSDSVPQEIIPELDSDAQAVSVESVDLLAENYKSHALYESMITNIVRSEEIDINEPADSITIGISQEVTFKWYSDQYSELELIILSNKGEPVKKFKGESPIRIKDLSKRGLYYWKLDSQDETLAAGKIYVR